MQPTVVQLRSWSPLLLHKEDDQTRTGPPDRIRQQNKLIQKRVLSELLHTARERAELNEDRAPSGPVKVLVTDSQPKRYTNIVDIRSGASSLLAWFPASKIAPEFLANPTENGQRPQILSIACPKRAGADASGEEKKQTLQAVRFAARNIPFFDLGIDKKIRKANFFTELIQRSLEGLVEPGLMRGLQPVGPCHTTLEVIIPSRGGLFPDKWKEKSYIMSAGLAFQL